MLTYHILSSSEPLCVVVEFVPGGSLDDVLLDSRIPAQTHDANYVNICSKLSERDLLKIAKDVANGMRHLESKLVCDRCALVSVDVDVVVFFVFFFLSQQSHVCFLHLCKLGKVICVYKL